MRSLKRLLIGTAGAVLWLLVFGFVMFASAVMREPADENVHADGIVVLTGGETRIREAARLLSEGRGERLLISGVNPQTRRDSLKRLSGLGEQKFNCCVDLGYSALDTVGNAAETRKWAEALRYDSLIVVTASYHMPRSLAELARAMPSTELIAHPVVPVQLRRRAWWLNARTTRILVAEYLKYLPAAARLGAARVLGPWPSSSIAAVPADPRTKT
ncbi:MAG TPA: YdcF family protein [Hyphomicrobiaceae bacterium]|nr:YdcF family protein [Hyphomicrobiaceae bacterium]